MAAATRLYAFWDTANGAIPAGWTQDTDYNSKFIRCQSKDEAIGTGGSDNHSHTMSSWTTGHSTDNIANIGGTGNTRTPDTHHHGIGTIAVNTTSALPLYLILNVIYNGVDTMVIPLNVIVSFLSGTGRPSGFRSYSTTDYYVRGGDATATGGGTHTHNFTGATGNNDATLAVGTGTGSKAQNTHTHTLGTGVSSASAWNPDRIEVPLIFPNVTDKNIPSNLVVGFNGEPPANWTSVSESGGDFYHNLLYSAAIYGVTTGSTHTHSLSVNTVFPSASAVASSLGVNNCATNLHLHAVTATLDAAGDVDYPAWRDMVFAYYTAPPSGDHSLNLRRKPHVKKTTFHKGRDRLR